MNFIELTRQQGGRVRIRADSITTVVEALIGKDRQPALMIQLGPNFSVTVTGDTMDTLFNKMTVAFGRSPVITSTTSSDYPNHIQPSVQIIKEEAA